MSAVTLVNDVPSTIAESAEFLLHQGTAVVAHINVHANGVASVPMHDSSEVSTAQQWAVYAIVNGITTETVVITNPDATVTLMAEELGGFSLTVS